MVEGVTAKIRRSAWRFALTGIVGIWLSGCADATRFADSGNPFSNPFATASGGAGAPTPQVAATPLAAAKPYGNGYATAARPSPAAVASGSTPTPEATGAIRSSAQPVGGSAAGWTAVGGSPVVVGAADDAATLSARYGVPEAALLAANGLRSRADVHADMRIVIPVYNAHADTRLAGTEEDRRLRRHAGRREADDETADADTHKSKHAEAERKRRKAEAKRDDGEGSHSKVAKLKKGETSDKAEKSGKSAKAEKLEKSAKAAKPAPEVAKAEPAKLPKKSESDRTPTGNLASAAPASSGEESSKLRWPARGRIIQGFKQGGNDGINIALPEGTSVRAAEDGKVAYAGSALKGYGNLVLIRHSSGIVTAYANNGELDVKSGDSVKRGQVIAKSGQTGDVSTPQLHFEVRKGQKAVDPTNYLAGL